MILANNGIANGVVGERGWDYNNGMAEVTTLAAIVARATVGKPAVETGCNLIENLLGEPCKIFGGLLADQIYFWQWMNRIRVAKRAKEIMDENGIASRVIPQGFLLPLIEAAGNVEKPELQELWAKLLASAVTADKFQHPSLIEALKQLTSDEAKIVKRMALGQNFPVISVDVRHSVERNGTMKEVVDWKLRYFSLLPYDAACDRSELGPIYLDNLCRLGFAQIPAWAAGAVGATMTPDMYPVLERHPAVVALCDEINAKPGHLAEIRHQAIRVTPLGRFFMEACIAPQGT